MRLVWAWLIAHFPVVVTTRRRQWLRGFNACELGRDYERGRALERGLVLPEYPLPKYPQ